MDLHSCKSRFTVVNFRMFLYVLVLLSSRDSNADRMVPADNPHRLVFSKRNHESPFRILGVTAFRDLDRSKWSSYKRKNSEYFNWFGNLLQTALPKYMDIVCFCESSKCKDIQEQLNFLNTIEIDLGDTFFKMLYEEKRVMESDEFKNLVRHHGQGLDLPERHIPEYTLINHSKLSFLRHAMQLFQRQEGFTHYAWLDFGFIRRNDLTKQPPVPAKLCWDKLKDGKLHIAVDHVFSAKKVSDEDILFNLQERQCEMQGYSFIVPSQKLLWYEAEYTKMYFRYHSLGIVDFDQCIALQVIRENYDHFALHPPSMWHDWGEFYYEFSCGNITEEKIVGELKGAEKTVGFFSWLGH